MRPSGRMPRVRRRSAPIAEQLAGHDVHKMHRCACRTPNRNVDVFGGALEGRIVELMLHVHAGARTPIEDLALHDIIMLWIRSSEIAVDYLRAPPTRTSRIVETGQRNQQTPVLSCHLHR